MPSRRPTAATVARAAGMLRAAGEPGRLRLLAELRRGPLHVSVLADRIGDPLTTVSQRLRVLRTAGLVRATREGRQVSYAIADDHVEELLDNVLAHAAHRRIGRP